MPTTSAQSSYLPTTMQVWAVLYQPSLFGEDLYQMALSIVDEASQTRIKRFYRREDSCRTLIGRLLVRMMLNDRHISAYDIKFATTKEGKPYIAAPTLDPPLAYNITHDNGLIALTFATGVPSRPDVQIGIDVMKVCLPRRDTFASLVESVGDQLSIAEHSLLKETTLQEEGLRRFFWMWTLKEAYTKALGLGLGFEFKRVEFQVVEKIMQVDGEIPEGWLFNMFVVEDRGDRYQGVVAEYRGKGPTEVIEHSSKPDWLVLHDAVPFTERVVQTLPR